MATYSDTFTDTNVRLDTKGFCIFCLKRGGNPSVDANDGSTVESKVDISEKEGDIKLRYQFSKVIARYLGTSFAFLNKPNNDYVSDQDDKGGFFNKKVEIGPQVDVGFICTDCSIMVEKLCRLFHELKKLEIELDWSARQLKNIMAFAKRAPTRMKIFREEFSNSGTREDMEALERIEMYRKEVLDKCSSKLRRLYPRIVLNRKGDGTPKSSRRRSAKRKLQNMILHDVEVQTEPISNTLDSPKLKQKASRTPNKGVSEEGGKDSTLDAYADSHNDPGTSSPAPPSPAYSSDVVQEEDSACFLRIRNIESLASPSKSVCTEESPVRQTRSSSRISAVNAAKSPDVKIMSTARRRTNKSNEKPETSTSPKVKSVLEAVPDLAILSSTPSVSLTTALPNLPDLRFRKATLMEWLQSTYNCNKCNKMFISEATLSVHKTTCGVKEAVAEVEDEEVQIVESDDGEIPMDIDTAGDSSEEEDDPLGEGEGNSKEKSEETIENSTEVDSITKKYTNTYEIRILTKESLQQSTKPAQELQGLQRYCKYCKTNLSAHHFARHRQTIKHKHNKRFHKKAKKLGKVPNAKRGNEADSSGNLNINGGAVSNNSTTTPPTSSTPVVTLTRDDNNVKLVKIIYVAKNGNAEDRHNEIQQKSDENGNGGTGIPSKVQASINNEADVIDISDD